MNVTGTISNNVNDRLKHEGQISVKVDGKDVTRKTRTIEKQGDFLINSSTDDNYLNERYQALAKGNKEITDVNLGLRKRAKADVAIQKDTDHADVKIGGNTYLYNYDPTLVAEEDKIGTTTVVRFERKNGAKERYRLPLYKADSVEDTEGNEESKEVYITYKIAIVNEATNLYAHVDEIREIFSNGMQLTRVYTINNGNEENVNCSVTKGNYNNSFKEYRLTGLNAKILPRDSKVLYLTFKLPDEEINSKLASDPNLENHIEIGSYASYDKDEKLYATFDVNSIPNNLVIDDNSTYENDNSKAPTLQITEMGLVQISGKVFEDLDADGELGEGKERKGNGRLDDNENSVANVTVNILNGDNIVDSVKTDAEGTYSFSVEPGTYRVQFVYGEGNSTYIKKEDNKVRVTVNDYKSTTVNKATWQNNQNNPTEWFKDTENRFSDALDNYNTRLNIDKATASLYDVIKNEPVKDTSKLENKVSMVAETAPIQVGIKLEDYLEVVDGDQQIYKFEIPNIDFGIIERPIQSMKIEKTVKSLTVVADNGQEIGKAYIDEDGKLQVVAGESLTGGPALGYIKSEMDSAIIDSGTTAKVEYNVALRNTSELDYVGENYYYFGDTSNSEIVKLRATNVYDYLKGLRIDAENNTDSSKVKENSDAIWQTVNKESEDVVNTETVFQNVGNKIYKDIEEKQQISSEIGQWYETKDANGNTMLVREKASTETYSKVQDWVQEDAIKSETKSVKDLLVGQADVISKLSVNVELAPATQEDYKFYGEVPLSTTDEDIRFDNTVEITDIQRVGDTGRIVLEDSLTYSESEYITITTPTGEDRDYVTITLITISAIAVLGIGIVLIKKRVLNK